MPNFNTENVDRLLYAINDLYGVDYQFKDCAESYNSVLAFVSDDRRGEFERVLTELLYSVQLSSLKVGAAVVSGIMQSANSPPAAGAFPIDAAGRQDND